MNSRLAGITIRLGVWVTLATTAFIPSAFGQNQDSQRKPSLQQTTNERKDLLDLKADPRLQAPLTGKLDGMKIKELLHRLQDTTQVNMELGDGVDGDDVAFAILLAQKVPAWRVMQQLTKSDRVKGRWEKVGAGYSLIGTQAPHTQESPQGDRFGGLAVFGAWVGVGGLMLLVLWCAKRVKRRYGLRNTSNSQIG